MRRPKHRTFLCMLVGLLCGALTTPLVAQANYQGLRLAVFGFETLRQSSNGITLRCQAANTGRLPIVLPAQALAFPPLVVELDSLHLPSLLREQPALIQRAIQREHLRLAPGEIRSDWSLSIDLRDTLPDTYGPACADLVIDTAYFIEQDERTLTVFFQLRNAGPTAARMFAGSNSIVLNTYFVSGSKLTRGAIFAEQITLKAPREWSDGTLPAGKSVHWQVKVLTKGRTRFSPHLALEFDPLQIVPDCGMSKRIWVIGD